MNFVLAGNINNLQFSFNETLSTRVALSLAETLGVSLGGVTKEVGTLGEKDLEGASQAVKGVGCALQQLFGAVEDALAGMPEVIRRSSPAAPPDLIEPSHLGSLELSVKDRQTVNVPVWAGAANAGSAASGVVQTDATHE